MEWTQQHADWLDAMATKRRVSNMELSRLTGVHNTTWGRLRHGPRRYLEPNTIHRICTWAGITEADLIAIGHPQADAPSSVREPRPTYGADLDALCDQLSSLPPEERQRIIRMVHAYLDANGG